MVDCPNFHHGKREATNTSVQNSAGADEISTSPGELKRSRIFLRNCLPQGSSCTRNLTSGRVVEAASVEESGTSEAGFMRDNKLAREHHYSRGTHGVRSEGDLSMPILG